MKINEIVKILVADKTAEVITYINRYKYKIRFNLPLNIDLDADPAWLEKVEPCLLAIPIAKKSKGDIARSDMSCEDYAYTHGGATFRAATKLVWNIHALYDESD